MTTEEGVDSITVLIEDSEYYNIELNKFFEDNQLKQFYTPEIKEPDLFIYHFENHDDGYIPNITIKSYWTMGKVEAVSNTEVQSTTYRTFEFIGLKSYNEIRDVKHQSILDNFLKLLQELLFIRYRVTKVDIYKDFHIADTSIKNFFIARISKQGMRKALNNPFNYFEETTFYVEDKDTKKPLLKTYTYDKSIKENISNKIIRVEASVREIKYNDYDSLKTHLDTMLSYYRLFYFGDVKNCNAIKTTYSNTMNSETKLSDKLSKKIGRFGGVEIDLSITHLVDKLLEQIYKE